MSFIANIASKLGASERKPVIRMRGFFKSSRRLTLHFPESENCGLTVIHACDQPFGLHSLNMCVEEIDGKFVLQRKGVGVITKFDTREKAVEVMNKITSEIAPSHWRTARRLLALWIVFFLLMPNDSSQLQPQASVQQTQMQQIQQMRQDPSAQMYVAPQMQQGSSHVAPPIETAGAVSTNDPFGLRLDPSSK